MGLMENFSEKTTYVPFLKFILTQLLQHKSLCGGVD